MSGYVSRINNAMDSRLKRGNGTVVLSELERWLIAELLVVAQRDGVTFDDEQRELFARLTEGK